MKTIITTIILTAALLNANATTSAQLLKKEHAAHSKNVTTKTENRRASRIRIYDEKEKENNITINNSVWYGRF